MWIEILYAAALVFGGIFIGGGVMAIMAVGANADRAAQSRHYQRPRDTSEADPWDYQP